MRRLITALVTTTAVIAAGAASAETGVIKAKGQLKSCYMADDKNLLCGMSTEWPGQRTVMVKYYKGRLRIHLLDKRWPRMADGSQVETLVRFDREEFVKVTGTFITTYTGSQVLELPIAEGHEKEFMRELADADKTTISVGEIDWFVGMIGSRDVGQSFITCAAALDDATAKQKPAVKKEDGSV